MECRRLMDYYDDVGVDDAIDGVSDGIDAEAGSKRTLPMMTGEQAGFEEPEQGLVIAQPSGHLYFGLKSELQSARHL